MRERGTGPRSELARYAYGYSDKKPGWTYYAVLAVITAGAVAGMVLAYGS